MFKTEYVAVEIFTLSGSRDVCEQQIRCYFYLFSRTFIQLPNYYYYFYWHEDKFDTRRE